jgi:methyl-accepting chemotaxis protein
MRALGDWTVRAKLTLLVALSAAGLVGMAIISIVTINRVKVYGPLFQSIVMEKDLLADILPPPEYIIETYLVNHRMLEEAGPEARRALRERDTQLRKDFATRRQIWEETLPAGPARAVLFDEAVPAAATYFAVQDSLFFPALDRGDMARARAVLNGPLTAAYTTHRAGIDKLVAISNDNYAGLEALAKVVDVLPKRLMLGIGTLMILLLAGLGALIVTGIGGRLQSLGEVADKVAGGDLTVTAGIKGRDEIAWVGHSFDRMTGRLRESMLSIAECATGLGTAADELTQVSHTLSTGAEETAVQANVVARATEGVNRNLQTVTAAADEMGSSIQEISSNTTRAAQVAMEAVTATDEASGTINRLGASSAEIGAVIKTITAIAEQTNLLALNATIEAARAGEMGKGFAVVANEVKELAKETARATNDISTKIQAIQSDTGSAVRAIDGIARVVGQISSAQNTIASAVEEQTATTREINRNLIEASGASSEIAANVSGVASAAGETTRGAAEAQSTAVELSRMAATLQGLLAQFRYEAEPGVAPAARRDRHSPARRTVPSEETAAIA